MQHAGVRVGQDLAGARVHYGRIHPLHIAVAALPKELELHVPARPVRLLLRHVQVGHGLGRVQRAIFQALGRQDGRPCRGHGLRLGDHAAVRHEERVVRAVVAVKLPGDLLPPHAFLRRPGILGAHHGVGDDVHADLLHRRLTGEREQQRVRDGVALRLRRTLVKESLRLTALREVSRIHQRLHKRCLVLDGPARVVALGLLDLLHGRCLLPPQKRRRQRAHARQREHRGHDQGHGPFFSAIREFLLRPRQHMLRHPRVACQA